MIRLLIALLVLFPHAALSQTVRRSTVGDSTLFVIKAGGTSFDSARVSVPYGGRVQVRVLKSNQTDTFRFKTDTSFVARTDYIRIGYSKYATTYTSVAVPARLVTPSPPTVVGAPAVPSTVTYTRPIPARRIDVAAGSDLQAALNNAQPGDELVLPNGVKFNGNYVIPAKAGTGWVTVRCDTQLPTGRVVPGSNDCATINTTNTEPALRAANYAARWWFVGVQITHDASTNGYPNYGIVVMGAGSQGDSVMAALPSDIVFDRVQIRGAPAVGNSRCLAFNGLRMAVFDSWITECHAKGQDAQGVGGWNGPGPFLIENNRIEASGQAIMFGGVDPAIKDLSPSDITIRGNHLFKPLTWGGGRWTVKAAFELKHGKRVLFEGNVIENHWADAQVGFAMLLQTLADNNRSWAWTTVQDITIRNNVIRNSTSGINILARVAYNGGTMPTNPTSRVLVFNNLWENVGRDPISGAGGIAVQLLNDLVDVSIVNNTFTVVGQSQKSLSFDGKPQVRTAITGNVFAPAGYPITGNATGPGSSTLNVFMPGGVFLNNFLPGAVASQFGPGALGNPPGANRPAIDAAVFGVVR